MGLNNGWVKFYRSIKDTSLKRDPNANHLFMMLLIEANISDTKIRFDGKEQILKRGQLLTGYRHLAKEYGMHISTITRSLERLKEAGRIETLSDTRGTIITICNYDKYQTKENISETLFETQTGTRASTRASTIREELRNKKEEYISNIKSDLEKAKTVWTETLKHFKKDRNLNERDEISLARGIQAFGIEQVLAALAGMRYEQGFETFDPGKNLSLARIFKPDKFEKFVNLGSKEKKEEKHVEAKLID